jgi:membrane fusion protein (multidrug efflux system)
MSRSSFTRLVSLIASLAIGLDAAACATPAPASQPGETAAAVSVKTASPTRGPISRRITLPSFRILPYQSATLYAKVSGYLKAISVDKGDLVKRGQLLAEIEVPELQADEAEFKAEANVARGNYERMAQARKSSPDLVIPETVDDLRGKAEVAEAKLQRTRALLEFAKLTAPFSGVITARFVDQGAFIPAATAGSTPQNAALLTVMDLSRLRVQVYVPETEVPFIRVGLPVTLALDEFPGRTFQGSVSRFANALDEGTKTMLTEIDLENPSGVLRAGMYASVKMEVERKPSALLLPSDAVSFEKAGTFVYLVANGVVHKTPVKTGFRDGANVEVADGVPTGAVIARVGKQVLTEGQAVRTVAP